MYSVYVDDVCIYNDICQTDKNILLEPKLTIANNSAGSFTCTLPPTNHGYHLACSMSTDIVIKQHGNEKWWGRIISEAKTFNNERQLVCEGALAFFNDSIQPQQIYQDISVKDFLSKLIDVHNEQVGSSRKFKIGTVTVADSNNSILRYTNYETTMDCIFNKLVDVYGGHLVVRKVDDEFYLDYMQEYLGICTQTINFGVNLLDFTQQQDFSTYATEILPLGSALETTESTVLTEYTTIKTVNAGLDYIVATEAAKTYGHIRKVVRWDDVTEPTNLLTKAQAYLTDHQFADLVLTVNAVDLQCMSVKTDALELLYEVQVQSTPHGLNRKFPITQISIPLNAPDSVEYTMGIDTDTTFTDVVTHSNHEIKAELKDTTDSVDSIKQEITNVTNNLENGMYNNIELKISSSQGNIFKNGLIDTVLTATVYIGQNDVTDRYDYNQFIWTRTSNDPEGDVIWNESHFGGTTSITITSDDVLNKATFFCDLIDTVTRLSLL